MQVYLVGGAVRDQHLGKPVKDKDFVVVGATVEQMLDNEFKPVGSDFPVFLHPKTRQEYALARTERKSGRGYKGFDVYVDTDVTLQEDLSRRDLTINAMAIEVKGLFDDAPLTGEIIDPFNGLKDIKDKKLRHVSSAFSEDPLRVLRVARFYSRFYADGFTVALGTEQLLKNLVATGELQHLTVERIWQETSRALMQNNPQAYWLLLWQIDALETLYPLLNKAWNEDKNRKQINIALQIAGRFNLALHQRWAVVMTSFKHPCNPTTLELASDNKSALQWITDIKIIGSEYKIPKKLTQFSVLYAEYAQLLKQFDTLSAAQVAQILMATKAHKDISSLTELLDVSHVAQLAKQQLQLKAMIHSFNSITIKDVDTHYQGAEIGKALLAQRIKAIDAH